MLLGAHVSIGGGYENALIEAKRLGADAIQIFTKNQRYWREKIVEKKEGEDFRAGMKKYGVKQAFSHAIYLISPGSENEEIIEKSILSLAAELTRCHRLGLSHTVLHPGAAGKLSIKKGIVRIAGNIRRALDATKGNPVKILLENTAGQGTSVGGRLENLAELMAALSSPRIGLCIDTCHAFAAGYDIRTEKDMEGFIRNVDKEIGIANLLCFHLNDSKGGLGSHLDRHQHIGEGQIGIPAFRYIMNHFPDIPKVIETPKEDDSDLRNLSTLRSLLKKTKS
jgi:deoxyribonuclease-4